MTTGLQDRHEAVRAAAQALVLHWYTGECDKDLLTFMEALDYRANPGVWGGANCGWGGAV